jgi:uncharacterized protein (TIGR02646 family)
VIVVIRGDEPPALVDLRGTKLAELRDIFVKEGRPPLSDEIRGYDLVKEILWKAQRKKCCYCERKIECKFYDVEHYRPKAGANHGRGEPIGAGYWWLAFTWENLLFSCKNCNEGKAKGIQFPLRAESIPLVGEQQPPRGERPLLIDPARECGIRHIQFRLWTDQKWRPTSRDGSEEGRETIRVCMLDRDDLLGMYTDHVNKKVRRHAEKIDRILRAPRPDPRALDEAVKDANVDLLRRGSEFVGLSYDALRHFVSDHQLRPFGQAWRQPA